MFRRILSLTMFLVVFSTYLFAQSTLMEDWEAVSSLPNAEWDVRVEDTNTVYPFIEAAGNPGNALNPGGQGHLRSCMIFHKTFQPDYTIGMEIDFDAYLVSTGSHYTDVVIDLMKDVEGWSQNDFLVLRMHLNKNGANERKVWMQLQSNDTLHNELMVIDGAYNSDAWNHGKIIVREDKRVEFYVNAVLLWTSTRTIDPGYSTSTKVAISGQSFGGPARMDNLRVHNFQAGPVAYYPLNGDAVDFSGNNHHGILSGTANFPNGVFQECLEMDGSSTHFSIASSDSWTMDERFSIAFWLRTTSTGGIIVERDEIGTVTSDWHIGIVTAPKLSFGFGTYDHVKTRSDVLNGSWQHLAFTREKSTGLLKIYVNGQLDTIGVNHFNTLTSGQLLRFGAWDTPGGIEGFWTGALDEVYIYDRVLTDCEIARLAARDTLRIGNPNCLSSLLPSQQVIPIYLDNADTVLAGDIPLCYDWAIDPASISFAGTRLENMDYTIGTVDAVNKKIRIGFVADFGGSGKVLPPYNQDQPIANIIVPLALGCDNWLSAPDTCPVYLEADTLRLEIVDRSGPSVPVVVRDSTRTINYRIGDCDGSGILTISDAVCMIGYIFSGGIVSCIDALDCDCSGITSISDVVYLINYIFGGGPVPGTNCLCSATPFVKTDPVGAAVVTVGVHQDALEVELTTTSQMQALQLNFVSTDQLDNISITATDPRFQVFSGWVEGEYRVGLIDLTGKTTLPAGTHDLLTISYEGEGELVLSSAIVVDSDAQEMNVTISSSKTSSILPTEFSLSQNRPNPFNPTTEISFSLPRPTEVNLTIYNILGEKVVTLTEGTYTAGVHSLTWDGRDSRGNTVASGVYFYRLDAGAFTATKKMLMMK